MSLVFGYTSIEFERFVTFSRNLTSQMHRPSSLFLNSVATVLLLAATAVCQASESSEKLNQAKSYIEAANSCDAKNPKCRITAYTKAIESAPTLVEAYNGRGLVYRATGELDHALADFNKVIELDPRSAQGYYYRAIISAAKNDLPNAIDDW